MKIDLEFTPEELGEERLAALSRESIRQRKPLNVLVQDYLKTLADDLIGAAKKEVAPITKAMRRKAAKA